MELLRELLNLNEGTGQVSSGQLDHALTSAELKKHADYMKKTHGVDTKLQDKDTLSYHGTEDQVRKAVIDHCNNDEKQARKVCPKLFKA